jgi:hypothetical protein
MRELWEEALRARIFDERERRNKNAAIASNRTTLTNMSARLFIKGRIHRLTRINLEPNVSQFTTARANRGRRFRESKNLSVEVA